MNTIVQKSNAYFGSQSMFFHIGVLIIFVGLSKWIDYKRDIQVKESLQLIEASVRIDVVAMPEFTPKELKNMKTNDLQGELPKPVVENKKVIESKNESKIIFNQKKKKLTFEERMAQLAKKKIKKVKLAKKEKGQTEALDNTAKNELRKLLGGNKTKKGVSTHGSGLAAESMWGQYNQRLVNLLKVNWKLPSYLLNKNLNCRVRIYIARNGRLIKAMIYESSGVEEYDKKALATVRKTSPFPNLAKEIRMRAGRGDIILGFPL